MKLTRTNIKNALKLKTKKPKIINQASSNKMDNAKIIIVTAGGKFVPGGKGKAKNKALMTISKKTIRRPKNEWTSVAPRALNKNSNFFA